ncbi:MAG: hypothetical protein AAF802_12620 [Planctomycetota bacterium]
MKAGLFIIWFGVAMAATSSLMVGHVITLPAPKSGEVLSGLDAERLGADILDAGKNASDPALVLHVLYGDCPCSRRTLDQLLLRSPTQGIRERIVFVGKKDPRQPEAQSRGFEVEKVSREQLEVQYGLQSAPLLVIVDHVGTILYCGGYTQRKQGPFMEDQQVIESIMKGERPEALPVFGCAVSRSLQNTLDPMRLKYSSDPDVK